MHFPLTALADDSEVGILGRTEGPGSRCKQRTVCYMVPVTDLLSPLMSGETGSDLTKLLGVDMMMMLLLFLLLLFAIVAGRAVSGATLVLSRRWISGRGRSRNSRQSLSFCSDRLFFSSTSHAIMLDRKIEVKAQCD